MIASVEQKVIHPSGAISRAARQRLLSDPGEPFFLAHWDRVLMIHFEVPADALQRDVPFELDLWEGRAFLTLVAFTLCDMRPRWGGKLGALLFRPVASYRLLNVRTYVRHDGEPGIHFLAEWLSSRLASWLGPITFSLPYRYGRISYHHDFEEGPLHGRVTDAARSADSPVRVFQYEGRAGQPSFAPCEAGSLDEWLMERYTAYNCAGGRARFFRVWHPPWKQRPVEVNILDDSLLRKNWPWFAAVRLTGANFSPAAGEVWLGRPHSLLVP